MRRLLPIVFVFVFVCVFVCVLTSCRDQQLTTSTDARLKFSEELVNFDTVFTSMGSSTRIIMVYNPNPNAVCISRVWWKNGKNFFANLDGENNSSLWNDLQLFGGDSLYLFIRTEIDPYGDNQHPIEVDTLFFEVNGNRQYIAVQAYGMDVEKIVGPKHYKDGTTFTANKPYLVYDTIYIDGALTIAEGATFYMHNNARMIVYGNVMAHGSQDRPIRFMGDRTDYLFPKVPYRVASGQWGGLFLIDTTSHGSGFNYDLENVHLLSGQVGLSCYCKSKEQLSHLIMHNARVHNMSSCGMVLENTHATISNVEISNCASYGLYLCGGNHRIEHLSVANYFGYPYTTINIHSAKRWDVAAVYIQASSTDGAPDTTIMLNSIITGAVKPAFCIDSIPASGYAGRVAGCYLRCDSDSLIHQPWADHNVFAQDNDTVFKNTYYKYGEYIYYDFHLTEHSPARFIGLPLEQLQLDVKTDLDGNLRSIEQPDAGCYTFIP